MIRLTTYKVVARTNEGLKSISSSFARARKIGLGPYLVSAMIAYQARIELTLILFVFDKSNDYSYALLYFNMLETLNYLHLM